MSTFLCVMEAGKGLYALSFLRQLKQLGMRVLVLTQAGSLSLPWPHVDGLYAVEDIQDARLVRNAVGYLFRKESIDRIIGVGEFDIEIAATLREFFRQPGLCLSTAAYFRDKLAMREAALRCGIPIPRYCSTFNDDAIDSFLKSAAGPWLIKPRTGASSKGIRRLDDPVALWKTLRALGDDRLDYLIERYTPGRVYHVDSIVHGGQVQFAAAHEYGTPIFELHQQGGVYTTRSLKRGSQEELELQELNRRILSAFGLEEGVTHIEYLRPEEDEQLKFLEASARVGAGMIEEMVEAASGLNLWAEWAKLEASHHGPPYELPPVKDGYAGVAICMTRHPSPDLSRLTAPGVSVFEPKPYHVALLARSDEAEELERLVLNQARKLEQAFLS